MATLNKKTLDGNVETMLLALLERGPSYGYRIVRDLNDTGGGLLKMGEGTVYPILHRLEERELIGATWRDMPNGRRRKYYRLTPRGRRALGDNRRQWASLVEVMGRVLGGEREPAVSG